MANFKLRIVLNIFLVIWILTYGFLVLFTNSVDAKMTLIFVGVLVIIGVFRDIKAPKQKRVDDNDKS